jgi:uncharacterized repeat protein (TIGR02543 family)
MYYVQLYFLLISFVVFAIPSYAKTIYVDDDASTNGNGTSWASAHKYLQDALAGAEYGDEIWVAEGTYKPDQGAGKSAGDWTESFNLVNGVGMYGGFTGTETTKVSLGDGNQTILSGEIDASSTLWSIHVVIGNGLDASTVMDGFRITRGNATASQYSGGRRGGGMYNVDGSPLLNNCVFSGNMATQGHGGGMTSRDGSPVLTNCVFTGNSASRSGGGWFDQGTLKNTIFHKNTSVSDHADLFASEVSHCLVSGGYSGTRNLDGVPLFVNVHDPDGPDDKWFTEDDGLRLMEGSPAIDAGHNAPLPVDTYDLDGDGNKTESIPHDLLARTRLVGSAIDLGPYEFDPANPPPDVAKIYLVRVSAMTGGTATSGGLIEEGEITTLKATPSTGYLFTGWSGDATETTNPLTITATSDLTITANFVQDGDVGVNAEVTLTSPDGATFGPREVRQSQSKNLLAVSTSQGTNLYRVGVEGGVSFFATVPKTPDGYGKQPLSLSGDLLVVGRESEAAYIYRIQADETVNFLANVTGSTVGQSPSISPASSPGWFARETSLSDDLLAVSEHGEGVVYLYRIAEDGGVAFLSKVKPPSSMTTVSRFGESISLSGDLLATTGGNNRTFLYRIEPNGNATYLNLVDKAGIADAGNISLSGDVLAIKPSWENKAFLYRVEADGTISEIRQLSNLASDSTRVSVTGDLLAAPPYLYRLQSNGDLIDLVELTGVGGISTPLDSRREMYALGANFIAAGGNVHFDSSWTPTVKIATVSLPYSGGSVTGGGQMFEGWNATLMAKSAGKYTFIGWTGDFTGKDNPLTLKADANMTVIANFAMTFNVSVTAVGGGTVMGSGPVPENEDASLTGVPDLGYRFVAWSNGASGTINPLTITVDSDKNITANFAQDTYDDDGDGLSNYAELVTYRTDPNSSDTDNDGLKDKQEIDRGWNPNSSDKLVIDAVMEMKGLDSNTTPYSEGWFYLPNQGWLWTTRATYPYFFDSTSKAWMYFQSGNEKPKFYHYGTKEWMTVE